MNPMQCIHWLLFSVSLLLSITLSASSTTLPRPHVQSTSQKYVETEGSSTAPTAISASMTQDSTVTKVISTSSIQTDTISTSTSPSFSQDSNITTMIPTSPTKDNSTDMTTTLVTTDVAQSTEFTTRENPTTTQTQLTPLLTSTSVPTSESAQTTVTAMSVSMPTSESAQTTVTSMTVSMPTSESAQTTVTTVTVSIPTETINTMEMVTTQGPQLGLTRSEAGITMFCGVVLGLTILTMIGYSLHRCKQRKTQYIHQPLYNSSEETVDRFPAPDDTLVISGGLYDGPESFNSALTADEDPGFHSDQPAFAPQPTHFRLEFLSEEQQRSPGCGASSTFETFQPFDAKV